MFYVYFFVHVSCVAIWLFAGGLLYTRDSCNMQYVTTASMILLLYSRFLDSANVGGVNCGSITFSPSQIKAFAKSQVFISKLEP